MISESLLVEIDGIEIEITKGETLHELSKMYQQNYKLPIILAKVDGKHKELSYAINRECKIEFLTIADKEANRAYVNGLLYLVLYAGKRVFKNHCFIVQHSIDKGIYIKTDKKIAKEDFNKLTKEMKNIIKLNLPIEKLNVNRMDAIDYFSKVGDNSKVELLKYNTNTYVSLYKLDNMYNFFFSYMPVETRCLERFDLKYLDEYGFVLLYQTTYMEDEIKSFVNHPKIFEVFKEYHDWISIMNIEQVPSLNKFVSSGNIGDLIRIDETLQSNRLLNIARTVYENRSKTKIVLIAGPSSSGKTTTCNKLSMYLRSFGLNPKTISMDNYFVDRQLTPKDEHGNYDYECLEALDLPLFDKQIKDLLDGKEVRTPIFDFVAGKSNLVSGEILKMDKNDVLIIEGIHALNPQILQSVPEKNKYKIYIGPFTCLNLDNQNRISTSDNRLLRRIIRDNRHRGNNVETTLEKWDSVRRGEEKYIFPHQDEADVLFNTALVYELGVLKTYVEPLLYSVDINSPYYSEAKRLINMLKMFLPIPSEDIPKESLLREFIGGGCFKQ